MKQRNKEQKRKVHSIRGQFAWIFIGLMIGTILLCLMINYLFLGKVYMQSKLDVIHDAYGTIKQAAESDSYDTEEFARELDDDGATFYTWNCGKRLLCPPYLALWTKQPGIGSLERFL